MGYYSERSEAIIGSNREFGGGGGGGGRGSGGATQQ